MRRWSRQEVLVRILCACALLFLGFGHKAPAAYAAQAHLLQLEELILPDGSLATLCLSDKHDSQSSHFDRASSCEACRLGATAILPQPVAALMQRRAMLRSAQTETSFLLEPSRPAPNCGPRPPPLLA